MILQQYTLFFAVVGWIDVFTRTVYSDLLLDSLTYSRLNN
jgi:putative transposase